MSTLKQQGMKAFIWDFSGKMAMHGMGFVVSIFLSRLLEPADFGLIALVMVVIEITRSFTDVGLGSALIQRRRVRPIHYASVFYFNLAMGTLLTLLTFFTAPLIAGFYDNPQLIPLLQVVSLTYIIGSLSGIQSMKLRKELNYARITKIGFTSSLLSGIVGISLAFYGAGVWALVAQALVQGILYTILIWSLSHWKPSLSFSFKALKQLWAFGFRMFLSGLLETIYSRMDTLIIGKLFAPATLGYFNRAKTLNQLVVAYSSGSLIAVLFPVLSKVQNDLPRFQNIIKKSLGVIIFVTFFLLGGLFLVSHELIVMLFGQKWLQTVDYFKILVLSGFGYPVSALLGNVLSSRGNSKAFLRLEIYKKIIGFSNLAIAFTWGIEGYLYGLLLVTFLASYVNIIFVSKEIYIPKWEMVKPILVQIVLTVVSVLVVLSMTQNITWGLFTMFILKGLLFSLVYIGLNWLLKTNAFTYFMDEFSPMFEKIRKKL